MSRIEDEVLFNYVSVSRRFFFGETSKVTFHTPRNPHLGKRKHKKGAVRSAWRLV
jgi:hypothetical protein